MQRSVRITAAWIFCAIWMAQSASAVLAQPVRDRVLGDVYITAKDECTVIRVEFNFPVLYLRHFSNKAGDELLIFVRFISVGPGDAAALRQRESAALPPSSFTALSDVVFEGDLPTGPYLDLKFTQPMTFEVSQGGDYRSVTVTVGNTEFSGSCSPSR